MPNVIVSEREEKNTLKHCVKAQEVVVAPATSHGKPHCFQKLKK